VTNPASFAAIVKAKSYTEVTKLAADPKNGVLLVPTNIYLFFQTVPGTGAATAAYMPMPKGAPATGGGSTSAGVNPLLIEAGLALLLASGAAGTMAYRRRTKAPIAA
jgi:hypothetical protein